MHSNIFHIYLLYFYDLLTMCARTVKRRRYLMFKSFDAGQLCIASKLLLIVYLNWSVIDILF